MLVLLMWGLISGVIILAFFQRIRIVSNIVKYKSVYVVAAPFIFIILMFGTFALMVSPGYAIIQASVEKRGQYGDSFGILNSLFTGLGFAGLVLTLIVQQLQMSHQARQIQVERYDIGLVRYDAKTHQLLEIYKDCVSAVILTADGKKYEGITALKYANDKIYKTIRLHNVSSIPSDIARRHKKNKLTEEDKFEIDKIFLKNSELINGFFHLQGRLIKTFTLLLRHVEKNAPPKLDLEPTRMLLLSQLTHVEISYFFLVALGFNEHAELRQLLASCGIFKNSLKAYHQEVHRLMYIQLWDYDPQAISISRKPPFKPMASRKLKKGVLVRAKIANDTIFLDAGLEAVYGSED